MSLPPKYSDFATYSKDAVSFLQTHQWLYSSRNTHILVNKLLDRIPCEWHTHFEKLTNYELNEIPFGLIKDEWPESLKQFVHIIESLKPKNNIAVLVQELNLPSQFFKGLNLKKKHEILALAPFIHEKCKERNINVIIDIGAGLGYLPQLLFEKYGYTVLAVEADPQKVQTAIKRQNELYKNSLNHVKYVQHFVDENSVEFLQSTLTESNINDNNSGVSLVGLHACADLTITLLRLFSKMNYVHQAVVMPCCYHRLKKAEDQINLVPCDTSMEHFANFPVSSSLRDLYDSVKGGNFLTSAFLRLACQNTAANWRTMSPEDHTRHSIAAMRRALLQKVTEEEGYHLSRTKRKTHFSSENDSFEFYLDSLESTHRLSDLKHPDQLQLITLDVFRNKMRSGWKIHEKDCRLLEIFTAFQTSIQSICENVVLLDRVEMVNELGYQCSAKKVTDDCISPRCYAIVANKQVT